MSKTFLLGSSPARRISLLECGPCALSRWLCIQQQHQAVGSSRSLGTPCWGPTSAEYAIDMATGAVLLGGASNVLVPASLVKYVESLAAPHRAWQILKSEGRLIVFTSALDAPELIWQHKEYRQLCVPVPGGALAARVLFNVTQDAFMDRELAPFMAAVAETTRGCSGEDGVAWHAWVRSALTCPLEGLYVPPIRVSELTARLLAEEGGCSSAVWEEAVAGLTPRWLETATKSSLSCGVPMSSLTLAFRGTADAGNAPRLMSKAVDIGISSFATCSIKGTPIFDSTHASMTLSEAMVFMNGWNELSDADAAEEGADTLDDCVDYVEAVSGRLSDSASVASLL